MSSSPRFIVGIDLGTTNSALTYVEYDPDPNVESELHIFPITQLTHLGEVGMQPLLPSFCYLPGEYDLPKGSLVLPWVKDCQYAVGSLARSQGEKVPKRLVASAKSWLCHPTANPRDPLLPWGSDEADIPKISPLEAITRYLIHLRDAWNHTYQTKQHPALRLEGQDIFLAVPASFDAPARELTAQAAYQAGFEQITLLEEPQAAFYAWLHRMGDEWRKSVRLGDMILVCDVGGGTTDLTYIAVGEEEGNLILERLAVGDHILLGGDNMDLALAHLVRSKFESSGHKLDLAQNVALWHSCRHAKEQLFANTELSEIPVTIVGRGTSFVGGTLQETLTRHEVNQIVLDGFFGNCLVEDRPKEKKGAGLKEMGLPYAADPVLPKHIARFLKQHFSAHRERIKDPKATFLHPTALLFNGGCFKAKSIQEKLVSVIDSWLERESAPPVRILANADYDLAVARGAAYYGLARKGKGIRIKGGTARSYYVGIEVPAPALPGVAPPIKALCVAPFGMEEGTEAQVTETEFALIVDESVTFRFFSSTTRTDDVPGVFIEDWQEAGLEELPPIETLLTSQSTQEEIPVTLRCCVTEVGTLELWCQACHSQDRWKLEFSVRDKKSH